ncbi:GspH/FimT family pseudopilin [Zestomonas thermotolerans]|uniref:GspH/FimT family pseudopilin n=1 Tax=Zestomonas thermotolerans TaxID=157784 RepID=UPI00058CB9BC|nr:GspH/FimT family pseudopilin [Pseudomonas thermotolerans]
MSGRKDMRGFTLVELMIILVLIGIIATIAVPNFNDLIQRNRVQTQAEDLKALLRYARGEAVSRKVPTSVTVEDDIWTVIRHDKGEDVELRRLQATPATTIRASVEEIRFNSNGTATAATFTVCHDDDASSGVRLEVQASGAILKLKDDTPPASCTL